jgi:hypothetical protein
MRPLPRWLAIVIAAVLVSAALFVALWALLSQLAFFGEQPTHQGRAALLLGIAVALVVAAFAALASSRAEAGERAGPRVAGARIPEAVGAAVIAGLVASTLLLPL